MIRTDVHTFPASVRRKLAINTAVRRARTRDLRTWRLRASAITGPVR